MNCPYCSNHKLLQGFNDLQTTYPQVAKEWNYKKNLKITPKDVVAGTRSKVWWICKKGHEWEASIVFRTTNNLGCPICSNRKVMKGYNDLQSQYPTLMKQWDFSKNILKTDEISYHYDKKFGGLVIMDTVMSVKFMIELRKIQDVLIVLT